MAQLLDHAEDIRSEDRDVTPPAVQPAHLESPFSAALPRTVAGRQRMTPGMAILPRLRPFRTGKGLKWRLDWVELSTAGLALACGALSVYRLFWAIKI